MKWIYRVHDEKGFVYVANFGDTAMTVNLPDEFEKIPDTAEVLIRSVGFNPEVNIGDTVSTGRLVIGPKHAIVVGFGDPHTDPPTTTEGTTPESSSEASSTSGGGGDGDKSGSQKIGASEKTLFVLLISSVIISILRQ